MILAPHIITATAASRYLSENLLAVFFISFFLHFLMDMIPHWDYEFSSLQKTDAQTIPASRHWNLSWRNTILDVLKIGADFFSGIILALLAIGADSFSDFIFILIATLGAILPDSLTVLYSINRSFILKPIQLFHEKYAHWWKMYNISPVWGIVSQLIITLGALILIKTT